MSTLPIAIGVDDGQASQIDTLTASLSSLTTTVSTNATTAATASSAAQTTATTAKSLAEKVTLQGFVSGVPGDSAILYRWIVPNTTLTLAEGNAKVTCETAATAETVLTLKKITAAGASSDIGTATIAIAGKSATIAITGSPITLAAGDQLAVVNQASKDTTAADFTLKFTGTAA